MIDFVKVNYRDKDSVEDFITSNPKIFSELRVVLETRSGEIEYPSKAKLKNMEVTITRKGAYLKNSLHKLNNFRKDKVDKNHNDFTYSALVDNINFIENHLPKIDKATLSILEFGLNIELDIPVGVVVRDSIMMHKYKFHNENKQFGGRGEYKRFDHSIYSIKVYDKSKQYNLPTNVLRFEIKYTRNRGFNQFGIRNILDLKNKQNLRKLFIDLMRRFDEMTIIDDYRGNPNISDEVKQEIEKYTSFNYWKRLSLRKFRNKKAIEIRKFNKVLEENNLLTTKNQIRKKLRDKFVYLINR